MLHPHLSESLNIHGKLLAISSSSWRPSVFIAQNSCSRHLSLLVNCGVCTMLIMAWMKFKFYVTRKRIFSIIHFASENVSLVMNVLIAWIPK